MPRYFNCSPRNFIQRNYSLNSNVWDGVLNVAETYGNYASLIVLEGPRTADSDAARSELRAHLINIGTRADLLPPGISYVGEYTARVNGRYLPNANGEVWRSADPTPLAEAIRTSYPGGTILWCERAGFPLESSWLPPAPELVGGSHVPNGTTVKLADAATRAWRSCGNCGQTDHDMRTCSKPPKAHDRIGVELEGRWFNLNRVVRNARDAGLTASSDGSVHNGNTDAQPYEIQTRPGSLAQTLNQVATYYPDEADSSCGMHVHVSFQHPTDFTCLSSTEFFDYFKQRWTAWGQSKNLHPHGQFFARLNGSNGYCHVNTDTPADLRNIDRYHQLNFSAWHEHKTVECRLLPLFQNQELALDAIRELLDIYETFLADPATFGLVLPQQDTTVEAPLLPAQRLTALCDIPPGFANLKEALHREIEMEDIAPPAPGMMRVAVPGGKFDFAMLQKIANMQKKVA